MASGEVNPGEVTPGADPAPCVLRDGRLTLDGVDLGELAAGLEGHAAWVLSHGAITACLAACDGPRTVSVGRVGPHVVLGMFAAAGWWARCHSPRELQVALAAGFPAERLVASGRVKDDGFLKDALSVTVGVLETAGEDDAANVARLATFLGSALPPSEGQPASVAACELLGCGGLFAPVLRGPPGLAIDAPWSTWSAGAQHPRDPAGDTDCTGDSTVGGTDATQHVWPVTPGAPVRDTLEGLSSVAAAPACATLIHGALTRGEWALMPSLSAFGRPWEDSAWPVPETVMTRDGVWRVLEERAPVDGAAGDRGPRPD